MSVVIPVSTRYDGRGFDQLERDAKRAQQAQIQATRQQIAEHRKAMQLTAKLDRELESQRQAQIQQYKDIGAAALVAGGIIVGYSADAVGAAKEAAAAEAQLAATIESTGGAAGQSLEALTAHASALQDITNFSDEAIMDGQGLLLTFTNIKDVFPEATQTMLDMSVAMDQDLKSSAVQLGKALNDPINGITALTRIGVTFTEQQKEQILAMMEMGDVAGAQRVILEELNREFGGSAEAAREAAGAQQDLNVSTGELSESWGNLLLTIGDAGVTGALVSLLDTLSAGAEAWISTIEQVRALKVAMGDLKLEFNFNLESFNQLARGIAELNPFVMLKNSVVEFYSSLREGRGVFESWRSGIEAMVSGVADTISGLMGNFTNAQENLSQGQGSHPGAIPGFQHGGSFTVGGSGGPDSQLVMFQATPGERVTVNPAHEQQKFGLASSGNQAGLNAFLAGLQSGFSGGAGASATTGSPVISQQINVTGMGGADLAAFVAARTQAAAEAAVIEYHEQVIVPLVNG